MPTSTSGRFQSNQPDGERRGLRSRIPYQAAEFYLYQLQHRGILKHAAIADDQGLLLVGIGSRAAQDLLALWGVLEPMQQHRYRPELQAIIAGGIGIRHRFEVGGTVFTVTGVAAANVEVSFLGSDLQRILSGAWPVDVALEAA